MSAETSPKEGVFRFTYHTDRFDDTLAFYRDDVGFPVAFSWDRSEDDKGALIKAGPAIIEFLKSSDDASHQNEGLDYRAPQGVYMCIQVFDIDDRFERYKANGLRFKQEITDQPWGHRTFSLLEPNDLVIFFYEERF